MLEFKQEKEKKQWRLTAMGRRPFIAELIGFDSEFVFTRRWPGGGLRPSPFEVSAFLADYPKLLQVRHGGLGQDEDTWEWNDYFILHGLDFENLQLTKVSRGLIARLLGQPLFSARELGSLGWSIVDNDVDMPAKLRKETAEVIQSPWAPLKPMPAKSKAQERALTAMQAQQRVPADVRARVDVALREWSKKIYEAEIANMLIVAGVMTPPLSRPKKAAGKKSLPPILDHERPRRFNFED